MMGLNPLCRNDVSDDDCYKCFKRGIILSCPSNCPDFEGQMPVKTKRITNLDRIRNMSAKELVKFFKYIDFTNHFPVIEGIRFYSDEQVLEWLGSEVEI